MEGFLFARFYRDVEDPDFFIFEDDAVIVGAATTASYGVDSLEFSPARSAMRPMSRARQTSAISRGIAAESMPRSLTA